MQRIIESIEAISKISAPTLLKLTDALRPLQLSKREVLISPLKKDVNVYFVEKGIARAFNVVDGKELTSWFSSEGELLYSTNSFHGPTKGYENETVQMLEDSLVYFIPIAELERLCQESAEIANWLRMVHQRAFVQMERRLIYRFYMSAEDRYRDFEMNHAGLLQRVNLGYIASFLGMSHVTLCALRKK
ncbi:MAG: Crp/Fnr family transcriptional regulator [Bacteroidales bacterium]